ncbi:MAG: PEP-CTERM sorting domain-containing protein [Verrucomicrobiae bacterium]|nr:PEP-CTERM sorting domain-containing protein [Verrucomicrobiae bacterium]
MKKLFIILTAALGIFVAGPSGQARVVTNFFDVDPQWSVLNNQNSTNNFGYSASTTVAGGSAGEVGGRIQRTNYDAYYADTASFGSNFLTLDNSFFASGKFDVTNANAMDNDPIIGHFSEGVDDKSLAGLLVQENSAGNFRVGARIRLANGTSRDSSLSIIPQNGDYWFSYAYDPNGGTNSQGRLSLNVTNGTYNLNYAVDLTAADRAVGATFDGWGLYSRAISTSTAFGEVYMDDVIYLVPEPSALALLGLSGLLLMWRRR